ncbi:hypothetical protein FT663_01047 [Candidozyma haemuli var. vulneris]|uniref:Uncharacterized protein n=1 Tax=Candidozyma haemuli TaxID=45357 RepID=A0A2V1ATW0_9ASCO|nr:hypothetical protein CXQ85_000250 [[Candida] haemuloni]KAF3990269.1 hypothetical protein FT662_02363 [[Candida] haemuloni var. vulneris]KAF3994817.1 hypothetical protein FT663_01047 [[Candida] haemuloni var. vulneris]PVH21278.1 hypothetical protein CXQ85_000250 [[Candida] haemuloni]
MTTTPEKTKKRITFSKPNFSKLTGRLKPKSKEQKKSDEEVSSGNEEPTASQKTEGEAEADSADKKEEKEVSEDTEASTEPLKIKKTGDGKVIEGEDDMEQSLILSKEDEEILSPASKEVEEFKEQVEEKVKEEVEEEEVNTEGDKASESSRFTGTTDVPDNHFKEYAEKLEENEENDKDSEVWGSGYQINMDFDADTNNDNLDNESQHSVSPFGSNEHFKPTGVVDDTQVEEEEVSKMDVSSMLPISAQRKLAAEKASELTSFSSLESSSSNIKKQTSAGDEKEDRITMKVVDVGDRVRVTNRGQHTFVVMDSEVYDDREEALMRLLGDSKFSHFDESYSRGNSDKEGKSSLSSTPSRVSVKAKVENKSRPSSEATTVEDNASVKSEKKVEEKPLQKRSKSTWRIWKKKEKPATEKPATEVEE